MFETQGYQIHDLRSRECPEICNWHEFLGRWQAATTSQELIGLLHVGFSLYINASSPKQKYTWGDCIKFYLHMADGWHPGFGLLAKEGDHGLNERLKKRQSIAQKSFDILCMNLFKPHAESLPAGMMWDKLLSKELFPAILNFFRIEEVGFHEQRTIINLSPHSNWNMTNKQHAIAFLLCLPKRLIAWRSAINSATPNKSSAPDSYEEQGKMFDEALPWLIEALAQMGKLSVLEEKDVWEIIVRDTVIHRKLEEIAMSATIFHGSPINESLPVVSLEEARFAGSASAMLLEKIRLYHVVSEKVQDRMSTKSWKDQAARAGRDASMKA